MRGFTDNKCPCGRPWDKCPWREFRDAAALALITLATP